MAGPCFHAAPGQQHVCHASALDVPQINPITVLGLTEVSKVPKGGWLLQTAAGSVGCFTLSLRSSPSHLLYFSAAPMPLPPSMLVSRLCFTPEEP